MIMSTAYENLKKHLELALRQLREIKVQKKQFDAEELLRLETQLTDLITKLVYVTEEA